MTGWAGTSECAKNEKFSQLTQAKSNDSDESYQEDQNDRGKQG